MQQLVRDALDEIWSSPDATNQYILNPGRLTPDGGVRLTYSVLWDRYTLPNNTSTFHLYQISQIHPTLINLFTAQGQWVLLSDACNNIQMVANAYTALGIEIPRTRTWYYMSDKKNVVLAVEKNDRLPYDFDEPIYLRTYRNPYFQRDDITGTLHVGGGLMTTNNIISLLHNEIAAIRTAPGYTGGLYTFVNGKKTADISLLNTVVGDVAEYVYNSAIYKVVDFTINSLRSFLSTLDGKDKYLLHYPSGWDGKIDFTDNIDMYLIDASTSNQAGVYVHKNAADTLRMVTYKDYSVVADYLTAYFPNFLDSHGNLSTTNLRLRLHISYDGIDQSPVEDANRLHYLLKLTDSDQVDAMVGLDAVVPVWNAAHLEQSAYTTLMRAKYNDVTLPLAEGAYGYSVANRKLAMNTQKTFTNTGLKFANAPINFQHGCTAYEYDSAGKLLGIHSVSTGVVSYPCSSQSAALVEFIEGTASNTLDEVYGENPTTILPGVNYRWYMRQIVHNVLQPNYTDVTDTNLYRISHGVANWVVTGNRYRIVRSDTKHYAHTVTLMPTDGVLTYTIQYFQTGTGWVTMPVPLGELDLWLNGHCLVPDVDYIVKFPTITIISKEYLVNAGTDAQSLVLRMTGFCKHDFTSQKVEEVGFVWDGVLSVDAKYGIHYYKSQRIVVGGGLVANEDATFVEDVLTGPFTNGQPYAVREMINHLNGFIDQDPYVYYGVDVTTDTTVSNYLSLKLGQALQSPINPIVDLYELYSPFICKIMYALDQGSISSPQLSGPYNDAFVRSLCAPYEYLLAGDPIQVGNTPDMRYCVIHPHWLTTTFPMSQVNFRFLSNVVRIYANGLVELSPLVSISV
jgi:hypothetical protein